MPARFCWPTDWWFLGPWQVTSFVAEQMEVSGQWLAPPQFGLAGLSGQGMGQSILIPACVSVLAVGQTLQQGSRTHPAQKAGKSNQRLLEAVNVWQP